VAFVRQFSDALSSHVHHHVVVACRVFPEDGQATPVSTAWRAAAPRTWPSLQYADPHGDRASPLICVKALFD